MSSDLRISPRERLVLTAIIENYISTGEPVASQAIARLFANKDGMSAATIRNTMASLGDAGLLDQPHTSAGRVPTAQAFRFYVEQLAPTTRGSNLTQEKKEQINDSFAGVNSSQQFLERTSHVLALISSGVGVALASVQAQILEHVHFSRLAPGRVLAVVVTMAGEVQDRVLLLDNDLSPLDLEVSARFLNENFHGWSIDRIQAELARRMEAERNEYDRLQRSVEELCRKGALESEASSIPAIFIEGVANLLGSELDRERLHMMLSALEAKQRLIELLHAYVDARQQNVRVVVGLEEAIPGLQNLVLIGAPARLGMENLGTVAVIGSTRIQYQETINAVSYIAQLSDRIFQTPQ
jgi:heat-inducible transcriptional repressor